MVNKVMLIGRLGADPEIRYTPSGAEVATFRMATTETWTNKKGEKEERTEWHRIVAWRGLAKICGEYLNKGKLVYIEGRIRTRNWEDKEGNKRNTTEIEAAEMKMLSPAGENRKVKEAGAEYEAPAPEKGDPAKGDEDIPF
ncbi:MAG: single-stranded DNA-binding protein [Deltaproteobacteria bacterium]|nr:single-stranded DNA-binding protein [Deltaproteobacteria bacterium]